MNLFRLAGHLGKTVAELEHLTMTEYREWLAFFRIEDRNHGHAHRTGRR